MPQFTVPQHSLPPRPLRPWLLAYSPGDLSFGASSYSLEIFGVLGQQPVLSQAVSPTRCPGPSIIISHRQAGRVWLGWVKLGWVTWARVRP